MTRHEDPHSDKPATFMRHLPGLILPTPYEARTLGRGLPTWREVVDPQTADRDLRKMYYDEDVQNTLFASAGTSHDLKAKIVISRGGIPRMLGILSLNIRALSFLEGQVVRPDLEQKLVAPILADEELQTAALQDVLIEQGHLRP